MLRDLLSLFTPGAPEHTIGEDLDRMIVLSAENVRRAGDHAFESRDASTDLDQIRSADKEINQLQRAIRKQTFIEMSSGAGRISLAFGVSIMNVVKDVERIGDYAKDLAAMAGRAGALSGSGLANLAPAVESFTGELSAEMKSADQVRAVQLIEQGKTIRGDLRTFQKNLLASEGSALEALASQYYLRITGHTLNVLSTLVTPLHHMDYVKKKDLLPEVKEKLKAPLS